MDDFIRQAGEMLLTALWATLSMLLATLLSALVVEAIRYARAKAALARQELERNIDARTLAVVRELARTAVKAAEQLKLAKRISDALTWALTFIQAELRRRGVPVNVDLIAAEVEAAVLDEFNRPRLLKPPALAGDVLLLGDSTSGQTNPEPAI